MENELIESFLKIANPFVMGAIEEIVPFDKRSDEQKNEIMRVALKSLEIATVITSKFYDLEKVDKEKLATALEAISQKNYEKAAEVIK